MLIPQFADRLEAILKEQGMTQAQLADKAGYTARHLSVTKNSGGEISEKMFNRICGALGMAPSEFLQDSANKIEDDYFPVPYREASGGMGGGSFVGSKKVKSFISLQRSFLFSKTNSLESLSFINAFGESMAPTIPPDAIVLIDESQREPVNGKIFFVMLNDVYLIKRIEVKDGKVVALLSDNGNKRYEIGQQETLQVLGRAILQQTLL